MISTISLINNNNTNNSNIKKNSFWAFVKWSFLGAVPSLVVYCCILGIALPLFVFMSMSDNDYYTVNNLFEAVIPAVTMVFTVLIGVEMFKDFHNKRSVDLYASFPVKRTTMFLAKYVTGLAILIIPLLIFTVFGGLVANAFPTPVYPDYEGEWVLKLVEPVLPYYLKQCGMLILAVISAFTMFGMMSLLCGTMISTIISYVIINAFYPLIVYLTNMIFSTTVPGFSYAYFNQFIPYVVLMLLSPCAGAIIGTNIIISDASGYYSEFSSFGSDGFLPYIICCVVFTALVLTFSCFIAKNRKNENVQNSFIYKYPKVLSMGFAVISFSIVSGYIFRILFYNSNSNYTALFLFGSLIGAVISFLIFTFVYNRGVKGFVKDIPVLGGAVVIIILSGLIVTTGGFGADKYVPDVEQIESVAFVNSYSNADLVAQYKSQEVYNKNGKISYSYSNNIYFDNNDEVKFINYHIKDRNIIEKVTQLNKIITDDLQEHCGSFYALTAYSSYVESDYYEGEYFYVNRLAPIQIQYKLKNGKIINRTYDRRHYNVAKIEKLENEIISSTVYKSQCFDFVLNGVKTLSNVDVKHEFEGVEDYYYYEDGEYKSFSGEENEMNFVDPLKLEQLYNTFIKDFMEDKNLLYTLRQQQKIQTLAYGSADYDDFGDDDLFIEMSFELKHNSSKMSKFDYEQNRFLSDRIYVPKSYENIWKLLNVYSGNKIGQTEKSLYISRSLI